MDWQTIINIGLSAALATAGWFARQLWDSVKELRRDIHQIEIDLPSNYVKKIDIDARFDKLEGILERIFDKLEQKADRD